MKRFVASRASSSPACALELASIAVPSSSGSAARPAATDAISSSASAGRPGTNTALSKKLSITTLRGVQLWLAEDHMASCTSAETQRISEAVAVLSRPKPSQEDVRPLQPKWQVARQKNKKQRPLEEVLRELQAKVIKAAQELQHQLADSAAKPVLDGSTTAADEDPPLLAHLKERQRKRATETETQDERPFAKPKAAKRQSKRTACTVSGSVETPASKRKDGRLTQESFKANALDPLELVDPGAASSGSAAQDRCRRMSKLLQELKDLNMERILKLTDLDDASLEIQELMKRAMRLTKPVLTWTEAQEKSMRELYKSRCGPSRICSIPGQPSQDCAEMTAQASAKLDARINDFVIQRDEVNENTQGLYPCLWEIKNRRHDAVLNSLPEMPISPGQLMKTLKDTRGETGVPFGRLPTHEQFQSVSAMAPDLFVKRLVCLELPHVRFADLPDESRHADLIEKVVEHRRIAAQRAELVTETNIRTALANFATDDFSGFVNKRWLHDLLKVPAKNRNDAEHLPQIFETAVADFVQDLRDNAVTGLSLSARALASLALYRHILIKAQKHRKGPMILGPIVRLLANANGAARKQYLPEDLCGEDVELTANRMPAYWRRLQSSAEQPVDDLSLPVASPPVMCWICGEGFLHNGALFKHCSEHHGDYAEYRKRLFWRAQKDGFKPLLPWVKRHMLESATFHLTYSVPGSFSLKWSHPEACLIAKERSEVACVVCARKDWLESRFTVYLWRTATGSSSLTELRHVDSGKSESLTHGEHLCFGNGDLVDKFLNTKLYCDKFPLIPKEHLYASSVLHPEDEGMSWLLHTRRVPMVPDSRRALQSNAEQSAAQAQAVLRSLYHNTSVQESATLTEWLTSALIAQIVCASRTSSLKCLVSLSLMRCGLAGSTHCFRMLHSVFAFFSDWVVLALGSLCWEQVAERTASLVLQVTMSWSRRGLHHLVRYCRHPRAISAIALWPSLAKIKKI